VHPEAVADADDQDFWAHKPPWCQPWTIIGTGLLLIAASWLLLHRWWITIPLSLAVLGWWILFLLLVPSAWRAEKGSSDQQGEGFS
jgi:hypothetical protein